MSIRIDFLSYEGERNNLSGTPTRMLSAHRR